MMDFAALRLKSCSYLTEKHKKHKKLCYKKKTYIWRLKTLFGCNSSRKQNILSKKK